MQSLTTLIGRGVTPTAIVLALVLVGCQTTTTHTAASQEAAPMDIDQADSPWLYLSKKYDADGDGVIVRAEYDRSGGDFDGLDWDDSGVITETDFEMSPMGRILRDKAPQIYVGMYFQDDDDADTLTIAELESAIEVYDASGDGAVEEDEFLAIAEDRKAESTPDLGRIIQELMGGAEPWDVIVDGVDEDGDHDLTESELLAFFHERANHDGVLNARVSGGASMSGPAEGELAPDFYLYPPRGQQAVALSSFQNNLPVALIFGSYT